MMQVFVSIADKTRLPEQARELMAIEECEFWGTEGSARKLNENGIPARDISPLVGGPPVFNHRVASISRPFAEACLARNIPEDLAILEEEGVPYFDFIYVNFYDLKGEIEKIGSTLASVIEKIDIGGPLMARMGAKGYSLAGAKGWRIVVCDPADWDKVIDWMKKGRPDAENFLRTLAAKAERYVAEYVETSAEYLGGGVYRADFYTLLGGLVYGENKIQKPAQLWTKKTVHPLAIDQYSQVGGSLWGSNLLVGIARGVRVAWSIIHGWEANGLGKTFLANIGKHGNPCGNSVGDDPLTVIWKAIKGDSQAAFGGEFLINFPLDLPVANILAPIMKDHKLVFDCIVAPSISPEAVEKLERTTGKCRFVEIAALAELERYDLPDPIRVSPLPGGAVTMPNFSFVLDLAAPYIEKRGELSEQQRRDMIQAWAIGSMSNSNTITLVKEGQLIGNAVNQQSRVDCARLAVLKAKWHGHLIYGAVVYSDSFFPFSDAVEVLTRAGVKAVFASTGSTLGDELVAAHLRRRKIPFVTGPDDIVRGFCGHNY